MVRNLTRHLSAAIFISVAALSLLAAGFFAPIQTAFADRGEKSGLATLAPTAEDLLIASGADSSMNLSEGSLTNGSAADPLSGLSQLKGYANYNTGYYRLSVLGENGRSVVVGSFLYQYPDAKTAGQVLRIWQQANGARAGVAAFGQDGLTAIGSEGDVVFWKGKVSGRTLTLTMVNGLSGTATTSMASLVLETPATK